MAKGRGGLVECFSLVRRISVMDNNQNELLPPKGPYPASREQEALQKDEHITEVIEAAEQGKLPTTVQLTDAIEQIEEDISLDHASINMSASGWRVIADTEKFLNSTKRLLAEKDAGDQFQNVIYYGIQGERAARSGNEITQTREQLSDIAVQTKGLLSDGAEKITRVGWLLVTSTQFRRLVNDVTSIFQELVASSIPNYPEQSKYTDDAGIPRDHEATFDEVDERVLETLQKSGKQLYQNAEESVKPYIKQIEDGDMPVNKATKELIQEVKQNIQHRLKNARLSSEQEDHLINRIRNVFRELQENPEFQEAVDELSNVASSLKSRAMDAESLVAETAETMTEAGGDNLAIARANAKELVEKFAGNKSLDPLIQSISRLHSEYSVDEELSAFVRDLKEFIRRSIRESQFTDRPEYKKEVSGFIDKGQNIMDRKYRPHFQQISNEVTSFNTALQHDRTTQAFARDLEKLTQDVFLDESGKPTIKYDLVKDFAKLVPVIAKKLEYLPLPRVEHSDEQFDVILDNIVLKCSNIAPDYIHLETDTLGDTNPETEQSLHNNVYIKFANIQVEAKNMAFYYKKKTFPWMTDVGYIDLTMPDDGITMDMTLNTTPAPDPVTGRNHVYEVKQVETSVKELKLTVHNSKHDILYKLLSPIINSKVRQIIEEQVSIRAHETMMKIEEQIPIEVQETVIMIEEQLVKNMEESKARIGSSTDPSRIDPAQLTKEPNPQWGSQAFDMQQPTVQHIRER
ncbi:hypothetical protein K493DRAFT_299406 [Basidiobolus meristosporus CBS 931.73]|uniref:HAM1-like N-terminal domain-containing protein n=1 Tax=Basidiobolus meristosporus CBS 931.73 TaxID=1314790 RepID=A0A1Y1YMY4_9FUNG|nr:hypothetical protein K493DRAFT_299406 [Basidiobolus meristosporus CBS 931.73]|eukprot:ORX99372.1 hypothetical protein K493DRAFT_299406 [Basidiobolus meristosporus CBS 931.73]